MNALLICGGRVIDPGNEFDAVADLLVQDGKVAAIGPDARVKAPADATKLDATGQVVCPGLIDVHVHLRQPGQSLKETVGTGTTAAAKGGFASVVCMPNTTPAVDSASTVALIHERAQADGVVNVFVAGAITKNLAGEELAPIGALKKAGVVAITDDGKCVQNNELMRGAMTYAKMFDLVIMDHCQDYSIVTDGVMNEGYYSALLGLRGWPSVGEEAIIGRNILLAELTGARVHCQHVSTAAGVRMIREAKKRGVCISGEGCPHHFTLTDAAVAGSAVFWQKDGQSLLTGKLPPEKWPQWPGYDTNFKMNPPLRTAEDREAVLEGLADGTLEIIASDHAPHCNFEKEVEFDYAPFGIIGLQTELALSLMRLYHTKMLSLSDLIAKFTVNPARMLCLNKGSLGVGADADITLMDVDREWVFTQEFNASKSSNTPFFGWPLRGKPTGTIVMGKLVWSDR